MQSTVLYVDVDRGDMQCRCRCRCKRLNDVVFEGPAQCAIDVQVMRLTSIKLSAQCLDAEGYRFEQESAGPEVGGIDIESTRHWTAVNHGLGSAIRI
jgi:hypothetical protein